MARIPIYDDVPAASQGLPGGGASAAALGGNIGQALEQVGAAAQNIGGSIAVYQRRLEAEKERKAALAASTTLAQMSADWELKYQDLVRSAPPGAPDFVGRVSEEYDRFVEKRQDTLDSRAAVAARPAFARARAAAITRAIRHEAVSSANFSRLQAEQGLAATINLVASNPAAFDDAVATGDALIGSLNLPADTKAELQRNHRDLLTKGAFEARLSAAKTPEEVDAIRRDLAKPEWQGRASPATYRALLADTQQAHRTIHAAQGAAARAAVEHLKERMTATGANRAQIEPAELATVDKIVNDSADPGLQMKWAQLRARYDAGRAALQASPDAVSATIAATTGQTGLPSPVQSAVDEAARSTGGAVGPSYLSQLVQNAHPGFVAAERQRPDYRPEPANAASNVNDLKPEVRAGLEVAGKHFGRKLKALTLRGHGDLAGGMLGPRPLLGGAGSESAVTIDAAGMGAATRAKLVDSLVRAGFTSFAQEPTGIRAAMTPTVPNLYGAEPNYGGFGMLDPEIAAVLDRRGFKAGRSAKEIDRGGEDAPAYASLQGGIFGFDDQTWLGLIARHGARLGLPIADTTTQADMLKWRQDPRIAAQVAALYAAENRVALQAGLGREVSDAELGIAHRLGPVAALALLRAYQDAPQTPVHDVLPGQYNGGTTLGEAYGELVEGFTGGVSALEQVRLEEVRRVEGEMNTARNGGDIMSFAARAGRVALAQLDSPEAFVNRGRQALEMQQFYRTDEPRPLTDSEVDRIATVMRSGRIEDMAQVLEGLQQLGPQAAAGAFRQVGATDELFAHVAGLLQSDPATAFDVLRGTIRMRDNPDVKKILTTAAGGTGKQFSTIVGSALDGADPRVRQSIRLAADALYIERFASGETIFDPRNYEQAVHAVLGTQLGTVNGAPTVLPRGVTAGDFDWALDGLTPQDLIALSPLAQPPIDRSGRSVNPIDLAYEGRFQAVGADTYRVLMSDGRPAWTPTGAEYHITLKPETVRRLADRARSANLPEAHPVGMLAP